MIGQGKHIRARKFSIYETLTALIANLLALLLCCMCFAGTTYAWFTSSTSSTVSTIKVGSLEVGLYVEDSSAEGGYKLISYSINDTNAVCLPLDSISTTDEYGNQLATIILPNIYINNTGNLYANYQLKLTKKGGAVLENARFSFRKINQNSELTNADEDVVFDNDGSYVLLCSNDSSTTTSLAPNESVGVQLKIQRTAAAATISGLMLVLDVAQAPVEADINGANYDASATFATTVTNASQLQEALENADDGTSIVLASEINLSELSDVAKQQEEKLEEAEDQDEDVEEPAVLYEIDDNSLQLLNEDSTSEPQPTKVNITVKKNITIVNDKLLQNGTITTSAS